jgi:tRNA A37 threonylcarbamoyladenosine synthetase subunit TsaC/SUA5/YrdC
MATDQTILPGQTAGWAEHKEARQDWHVLAPHRLGLGTKIRIWLNIIRAGWLIAYPTDSCFAFGCQIGNRAGLARIRDIRHLDDRHHSTLICRDFARFVKISNSMFRLVKASTPGTTLVDLSQDEPELVRRPSRCRRPIAIRVAT